MSEPSAAYIAALEDSKAIHKGKQFTGKFLRPHAIFIKEIIDRKQCKTVLDYGCGKGQQYEWVIPSTGQTIEQFWGASVTKYDPAYPPFAKEPEGKFDLVICTQVLGTIPIPDLRWVVDRIFGFAKRAVYVSERLTPPRKQIGDHALRPVAWDSDEWMVALERPRRVEVTLATRKIVDDAKITEHFRTNGNGWKPVYWPEGVTAMNHKWAP